MNSNGTSGEIEMKQKTFGRSEGAKEKEEQEQEYEEERAEQVEVFVNKVSVVGIVYVVDSRNSKLRRVIWVVWLLFGVGLAFFQVQDRISAYLSYPYNTRFEMISVDKLRFPQVTVCKQNWMMKSKVQKFGVDNLVENITIQLKQLADLRKTEFGNWKRMERSPFDAIANWSTLMKNLSFPWQDLVRKIVWNGDVSTGIIEEIETDLGFCFAVSTAKKPLHSTQPGLMSGLELHLDVHQSDTVHLIGHEHDIFSGFRVLIHDELEIPRMYDAGFVVSPGSVAQVAVSIQNVTLLGLPYFNCSQDPTYRVTNCWEECENRFFFNECRCRPFYYNTTNLTTLALDVCSYMEYLFCLDLYKYKRETYGYECNCLQQCYNNVYSFSPSRSDMSKAASEHYNRMNPNNSTANDSAASSFDTDYTVVFIYYPNLIVTSITLVEAFNFFMLLSDIGGALSLLLGATLLTVYEIIEFMVVYFAGYLRKLVAQRKTAKFSNKQSQLS